MTWEELQNTLNEMEKKAKGEALAFLLVKERKRHLLDINKIDDDLDILARKGIKIPHEDDVDVNLWIEP